MTARIFPGVLAMMLVVPLVDAARPVPRERATPTRVEGQDTPQPERGEQILNAACTTACHDTRPIDTQALDDTAWTKEIKSMVEKGAKLNADDERPLVDYLVTHHGPMPDGPGKELVLNICTQCHDLGRVRRTGRTPEGWLEVLENMLNEGAPLSDKDLPDVLRYLARNFKPER